MFGALMAGATGIRSRSNQQLATVGPLVSMTEPTPFPCKSWPLRPNVKDDVRGQASALTRRRRQQRRVSTKQQTAPLQRNRSSP